jgi:ubiquinol-cytochrome c reductase cytochrome b subunit
MSERKSLADALDERIGYRHALKDFLDEKIVGGARWTLAIGSALIMLIAVEAITGLVLMTAYSPSSQTAWASVHYIQFMMPLGWLVRGIHYFGSNAIIALTLLHLARTAIAGAYKGTRDVIWWLGLLLAGLMMGFAISGSRLMWDQFAYWALQVETNVAASTPVVGGALARMAQGGSQAGHLTLTRLYTLHVAVLPLLTLFVVGGHSYLRRRHGFTPGDPTRVDRRSKQLMIDMLFSLVVIAVVLGLAVKMHGAPLDAPADPTSDYPARPEWYLAPLYQLRKMMPGKLEMIATMVIPGIAVGFLAALPFIDRKPGTNKAVVAALVLGLLAPAGLVVMQKRHDARDEKFQKALAAADARAKYAIELAKNGVPPDGPLEMLARDPLLRGEEIWKKECRSCHTLNGKGDPKAKKGAPDLKDWGTAAWAEETVRDPDAPHRFGKGPFKGEMPSAIKAPEGKEADFKPMPEPDIKAVAAYVAGDTKNARGAEVYGDWCSGCHKLDGKGGDDSDLAPDLTGWGTYRWLRSQIADPAAGDTYKPEATTPKYKGHMPVFNKSDIAGEIDVIARWVYLKTRGQWPTEAEMAVAPAPPAPTGSASASASASESASPPPSASPSPPPPKKPPPKKK